MPNPSTAHRAALLLVFTGAAIAVTGVFLITGEHRGWTMPLLAAGFITIFLGSMVAGKSAKARASAETPRAKE